MKNHANKCK